MKKVKAGEIYMCLLEGIDSEQTGLRPVLICSTYLMCLNSPNIQIIPLTKQIDKGENLPTHFVLKQEIYNFLNFNSMTLGENVVTISKTRLQHKIGLISNEDLKQVIENMQKTFY